MKKENLGDALKISEMTWNGNGRYLNKRQICNCNWTDINNQNANDKVVKEEKKEGKDSGASRRKLSELVLYYIP